MATCYQCGSPLPRGGGSRREVMTGTTLGLSYGRSVRPYQSVHFGRRLLCASCAERHDEGSRWALGIIATVVGSIIVGLILMSAGAPGAAILFVVCAPCLVFFAAWIGAATRHRRAQTPQPLPPPDKNDPHYYQSPGQHGDYFDKPHD
jgi:hypothetical protein